MEWILLGAALLPLVATIGAKAGGQGFDNAAPREWLQQQAGWRARANAAQSNTFEALPFFFAVMIFAYIRAPMSSAVLWLGILWLFRSEERRVGKEGRCRWGAERGGGAERRGEGWWLRTTTGRGRS